VKDDGVYVDTILECIGRVQRYTADRREAFFTDEMTQDAVLRNLQILAESCGRLPREIRDRRREIDWKGIAGFRNVVVHDYLDLNLEKIWEIIQVELPPLAIVMGEELARIDADLRELNREGST
jgi:uncharacterized protein with HEPN domain